MLLKIMIHFFFLGQRSGISIKMPESTDELKKNHANIGCQAREDSEYVRLVIPSELKKCEPDILESQGQEREGSRIWWVKTTIWCSLTVIILLIFVKWGLPFLVKKVGITCLFCCFPAKLYSLQTIQTGLCGGTG